MVGLLGACGGEQAADIPFAITDPVDGAEVDSRIVQVSGTAPPGSTVVYEIRLWPDERVTVSASGEWTIQLELWSEDTELSFRLGEDAATRQTLTLRLDPALAGGTRPLPFPGGGNPDEPEASDSSSPTPLPELSIAELDWCFEHPDEVGQRASELGDGEVLDVEWHADVVRRWSEGRLEPDDEFVEACAELAP